MASEEYVMTIDSDDETAATTSLKKISKRKLDVVEEVAGPDNQDTLNPDFTFDLTGDVYADVLGTEPTWGDLVKGSKRVCHMVILLRAC